MFGLCHVARMHSKIGDELAMAAARDRLSHTLRLRRAIGNHAFTLCDCRYSFRLNLAPSPTA
jgi:hypothetical protein